MSELPLIQDQVLAKKRKKTIQIYYCPVNIFLPPILQVCTVGKPFFFFFCLLSAI